MKKRTCRIVRRPTESRAAEVTTVAWALLSMSVLVADGAWMLSRWLIAANPEAEGFRLLANISSAAGLILGTLCLAGTPLVMRLRPVPPPIGFVAFAAMVSLVPWLAMALR